MDPSPLNQTRWFIRALLSPLSNPLELDAQVPNARAWSLEQLFRLGFDSMTRNNLPENLGWLLRSNATREPPAGPRLPAAPPPDTPDSESQDNFVAVVPTLVPVPAPAPASFPASFSRAGTQSNFISRPNSTSTSTSSFTSTSNFLSPPITAQPSALPNELRSVASSRVADKVAVKKRGMDRLFSNTRPDQPTLGTKQQPLPTPASTTGTDPADPGPLQRAYSASLARESPSITARSQKKSSSSSLASDTRKTRPATRTPARTAAIADIDDYVFDDALDLTEADNHDGSSSVMGFGEDKRLWREDFAERPEPASSHARKRDLEDIAKTPGARKKKEVAVDIDDDGFLDIEDLILPSSMLKSTAKQRSTSLPTGAESPCSQLVSGIASLGNGTVATDSADGDDGETDEVLDGGIGGLPRDPPARTPSPAHGSNFATSGRKRKTPSSPLPIHKDALNLGSGPGPVTLSQAGSKSKRTRRDVVWDSEEDEFEGFATPPSRRATVDAETSPEPSEMQQIPDSDQYMDIEPSSPPVETPSKGRLQFVIPPTAPHEKNKGSLSSDPIDAARSGEALLSQESEHKEVSQGSLGSELERNRHVLDMFLSRPSIVEDKRLFIKGQLRQNHEDYTKCLRENAPKEEREQVRQGRNSWVQKQKVLDILVDQHKAFKDLGNKQEALVTEIGNAYFEGHDTTEDEARLDQLSEEINAMETALIGNLVAAGIDDLDFLKDANDSIVAPDSPATPVVFGTQPSHKSGSRVLSNENTSIPEYNSQVVLQTQLPRSQSSLTARTTSANTPVLPSALAFSQACSSVTQTKGGSTDNAADRTYIEILDDSVLDDNDNGPMAFDSPVVPPRSIPPMSRTRTPAKTAATPYHDYFNDDEFTDEEEMLAAADVYAQKRSAVATGSQSHPARSALSETSGNTGLLPKQRPAAKIAPSLSRKASMPPELMKYPWSPEVRRALKDRFRMNIFRHNQLEAINATLAGKDAFVLMPTGGGKSLCYQLPAVINSGKTRGITIVVSPLLSLMHDQVAHLEKLNILARPFNGQMAHDLRDHIMEMMDQENPEHFVQLLYVTPEMVVKNQRFKRGLETLHRKQKLARIVIDEAHCVSHWGHDFRPDYKEMGGIRRAFPGVPVMALTATATENVIADVKHNLNMANCQVFSQSFNRPNLYYEVMPKAGAFILNMGQMIKERYSGQSGIVYTLSRKSAETTAAQLVSRYKIKARYYHAQMEPQAKADVQKQWQDNKVHVVVATIAFGMGIDKPDVRFVVHQSLPKSLEGYYQETGRAGRDGKPSDCYLYFQYNDVVTLRRMINNDIDASAEKSPEEKERQNAMLNRMLAFSETTYQCRRVNILHYFGEKFDIAQCNDQCDNCRDGRSGLTPDSADFTNAALAILKAVRSVQASVTPTEATMSKLTEIVTLRKNVGKNKVHEGAGDCKGMKIPELQRIIVVLQTEGALDGSWFMSHVGVPITYFHIGRVAQEYFSGKRRLKLEIFNREIRRGARAKSKGSGAALDDGNSDATRGKRPPPSTNISSPVHAMSNKRKLRKTPPMFMNEKDEEKEMDGGRELHGNGYEKDNFVVSDHDEEDDAFEPVPAHRPLPPKRRQQTLAELGPPLSRDTHSFDTDLNEIHRDVIGEFIIKATEVDEQLRNRHGLRRPIFTEQQYKEMAARWTTSTAQMYTIRGVDREKVDQYGPRFAREVQHFYERYQEMMGRDARRYAAADMVTDEQPEIVNLCSDDEDATMNGTRYVDMDAEEDDDDEDLESSRFFSHGAPAKASSQRTSDASSVQQWHKRFDELNRTTAKNSSKASQSNDSGGGGRRSGSGWKAGGKKSYPGKKGARNSAGSGVFKRKGSVSRQSNGRAGPGSKKSGGGSGSGISTMPY